MALIGFDYLSWLEESREITEFVSWMIRDRRPITTEPEDKFIC
jgi:hypothetical protein